MKAQKAPAGGVCGAVWARPTKAPRPSSVDSRWLQRNVVRGGPSSSSTMPVENHQTKTANSTGRATFSKGVERPIPTCSGLPRRRHAHVAQQFVVLHRQQVDAGEVATAAATGSPCCSRPTMPPRAFAASMRCERWNSRSMPARKAGLSMSRLIGKTCLEISLVMRNTV